MTMTYSNLCACPALLRNEPVKTTLNLAHCCATLTTRAVVHSHVNINNKTNKTQPVSDCGASTHLQKQNKSSIYPTRNHHSSGTIKSTDEVVAVNSVGFKECSFMFICETKVIMRHYIGLADILCTAQVRLI